MEKNIEIFSNTADKNEANQQNASADPVPPQYGSAVEEGTLQKEEEKSNANEEAVPEKNEENAEEKDKIKDNNINEVNEADMKHNEEGEKMLHEKEENASAAQKSHPIQANPQEGDQIQEPNVIDNDNINSWKSPQEAEEEKKEAPIVNSNFLGIPQGTFVWVEQCIESIEKHSTPSTAKDEVYLRDFFGLYKDTIFKFFTAVK